MRPRPSPSPPLRVTIDGRLMYYRQAGISTYTRRLVQAMAALGDPDCQLHVLLDRRDVDTRWVPASVPILRTVTPAHHASEHLALPIELAALSLSHGPFHIVHFPDFIACRGAFKKVITIHDLYFMEHPEVMSADAARYYGRVRASAQRANHIIAVSAFTQQDILRLMPTVELGKVSVVHEAADLPSAGAISITPTSTNGPNDIPQDPYALFVGTFEPRKNLKTLLQGLALASPQIRLVIVGEAGWVESEPARLAQALGLQDRVSFAGRVSDEALDTLYRQAHAFVFPSLSEGFGLPVLEAMSRGVPVICSDAGALHEVAGDAALLHAPTDAPALAQHLDHLWTDESLRVEYRRRSLQRASQFSWHRAALETLLVYKQQ